ncbi:MAG: condensation domain-containing protein, partial [Hyphomicrobiaceae bacterium]
MMSESSSGEMYEFPVSATQATFWYMYQMDPEGTAYTIPLGFRIKGDLDPERLRQSLLAVVARHEILRTRYCENGEGKLLQIVSGTPELPFNVVPITGASEADKQLALDQMLEAEFHQPILIDREPPLRARVYEQGDRDYVFLFVVHHIAVDHMAIGFLLEEMAENYRRLSRGERVVDDEPELQYADYVVWQTEQKATADSEGSCEAWKKRLQPFSGVLELPLSFARPRYQTFEGHDRYFSFGQETTDRIRAFSRQRGLSLFSTMLACLMAVYQRYTRQTDIIVGTPFSDRNQDEQLERVMGCFINTLPLAAMLDEDISFDGLLAKINEVMMEAYDHQAVPLEDIVHELELQRDVSRNPLFQVGFVFQEPPMSFGLPEAQVTVMPLRNFGAMYDLHTFMWDDGDRIGGL